MSECYPRALLLHGKDYERDSLRVMVTAVDRHLLEMEYQSRLRGSEWGTSITLNTYFFDCITLNS